LSDPENAWPSNLEMAGKPIPHTQDIFTEPFSLVDVGSFLTFHGMINYPYKSGI